MAVVYVSKLDPKVEGGDGYRWSCTCGKRRVYFNYRGESESMCREEGLAHQLSHDALLRREETK